MSAYRDLEQAANRQLDPASSRALENAIADVQLLGSPRQVQLANDFAVSFAEDGGAELNELSAP